MRSQILEPLRGGDMAPDRTDSSTHIAFTDGTSSASGQPIIETTAPSNNLASIMANWAIIVPSLIVPPIVPGTEDARNGD